MSVQIITRQALLDKMSSVIKNLPVDQLQQAWEQIETWETPAAASQSVPVDQRNADDKAVVEFHLARQPLKHKQRIHLPLRSKGSVAKVVMEVGDREDGNQFFQKLQANVTWWNEHYAELCSDATLQDQYVAISSGEVFSGNTYQTAYDKAHTVQADAVPYVFFLKTTNGSVNHAD